MHSDPEKRESISFSEKGLRMNADISFRHCDPGSEPGEAIRYGWPHRAGVLFVTMVALLVCTPVLAQPKCEDLQTQTNMNICSHEKYQAADLELNKVYQKALGLLNEEEQKVLRENQRAWIKYRDLTCKFETLGEKGGGTIWPLVYSDCMERLTKQRTEEIPNGFMEWKSE